MLYNILNILQRLSKKGNYMKTRIIPAALIMLAALSLSGCGGTESANLPAGTDEIGFITGETERIPPDSPDYPEIPAESPVSDFTYEYSEEYGGIVITDYMGGGAEVRIPDTIEGERVVCVNCVFPDEVTQIEFPDTVFGIRHLPESIEYFNIPAELEHIGDPDEIAELTEQNLGISDAPETELPNIRMIRASGDIIPINNPQAAISAFGHAVRLSNTGVKYFIAEGADEISSMTFSSCEDIEEIAIPEGVTKIGEYAFAYCPSLTRVKMPDSLTEIGASAFSGCNSLTSIRLPDSVTAIGEYAFSYCVGLTDVTLPDSITEISWGAFRYCTGLTDVKIPGSVTAISAYAFSDCGGLTGITIPGSVTELDDTAFYGCTALTGFEVGNGSNEGSADFTAVDGILYNSGRTELISYPAGKTAAAFTVPDGVTSIGDYSFGYCGNLKSITLPEGVKRIGWNAFTDCTGLESIELPESLTEIDGYAFESCSNLKSITLPDSITEIDGSTFDGCSSLKSITIPDSVTEIGEYAFSYCSGLKEITIPAGVTEIDDSAFYSCGGMTAIEVAAGNPSFSSSDGILYSKDKTVLLSYPAGKGDTAFTVPDGVTEIGGYAFDSCEALESVTIPDSVTRINDLAFSYCSNLKSVSVPGKAEIAEYAFDGCNDELKITYRD